jgi:hypothetical protein
MVSETPVSGKVPWEPMKLVPVGTVAALLQASGGSQNDANTGSGPKMMVGL